jgi:type II secretory pathway pseudopilin PulG
MATRYSDRIEIRSEARCRRSTAENGYVLVAVMFMLAILVLGMAVAVPRIKQDLQRDREVEAMHRGKQYIRAVQLYYRKFNAYPPNLDALVMTNDVRFLRKKYVDPITGKDDWAPIHLGQNKVPTVMGFFGQPLAISSMPGTAPSGILQNGTSAVSNEEPVASNGSSDSAGGQTAGSGSSNSTGSPTFGGGSIIGFSIPSEKRTILVYKKQQHFNQWEFVYDPMLEQLVNIGGGAGATTGSNSGTPGSTYGDPTASGGSSAGTSGTPPGNQPAPGGLPPGMAPLQPACGGTYSPNGNLPAPCPQ